MHELRKSLSLPKKGSRLNKWLVLIFSLVFIIFFVTIGLPFLSQVAGFSEMHQVIIDEDIHAGEWFYIFVEQIREIEPRVRNTLKYSPGMEKVE